MRGCRLKVSGKADETEDADMEEAVGEEEGVKEGGDGDEVKKRSREEKEKKKTRGKGKSRCASNGKMSLTRQQ